MEKLNMPVANLATGIYTEDSLELILTKPTVLQDAPDLPVALYDSTMGATNAASFILDDDIYKARFIY